MTTPPRWSRRSSTSAQRWAWTSWSKAWRPTSSEPSCSSAAVASPRGSCWGVRRERPAGSYTVELLDDPGLIGEKVEEEAEEVARAAREESDERLDEEAADVLYHLAVLLRSRGRTLADAEEVLNGRRR